MSQHGLRFTLKIDGLPEMTTAVVGFSLYQRHSTPLYLKWISPAAFPTSSPPIFSKRTPCSPSGRVQWHYAMSAASSMRCHPAKTTTGRWVTTSPSSLPSGAAVCVRTFASSSSRISGPSPPPFSLKTASQRGRRCFMNRTRHASSAFSMAKPTWIF